MKFTSNITLILSFHTEMGKCNPQELYEILRNIKPDVIFEELPGHVFQSIYSGQKIPHTVESRAISSYIRYHNVNHVPVDTYEFDMLELFSEYDFIFERSELYKKIFEKLIISVSNFGFSFLNSLDCAEIISELKSVELKTLEEYATSTLVEKYLKQNFIHNQRETEMLKNIYKYTIKKPYNNAVLICGTDHKNGILEKLTTFREEMKCDINWSIYGS